MRKSLITIGTCVIAVTLILPVFARADENTEAPAEETESFRAKVIEVIEEVEKEREDGSKYIQQDLKLEGLNGSFEGQEIEYRGISEAEIVATNTYEVGDKVIVEHRQSEFTGETFNIVDHVREGMIYFLAALFAVITIVVGKWKGLRALFVLAITFFIILQLIVPLILEGAPAVLMAILGSLIILILATYITEGFNKRSNAAVISMGIALVITGVISVIFTQVTKLTGFYSEEALYLIQVAGADINLKGLVLAGMIIGAVGVLDDVVISQVSVVEELKRANDKLDKREMYKRSMKVGVTHIGAMINTLFIAYAGAALPTLTLFTVKNPPFDTFSNIVNNEVIATEIVRGLTGSIGLILAVPIATWMAIYLFGRETGKLTE